MWCHVSTNDLREVISNSNSKFKFKKCLLTHNTWFSNLNNRPQCVIKIKETDKRRKKAGRWHISRYIKYISRKTENERISISGSTLNQVWHIWVSLQLNDYASQRGLETLMGLCAHVCFKDISYRWLMVQLQRHVNWKKYIHTPANTSWQRPEHITIWYMTKW